VPAAACSAAPIYIGAPAVTPPRAQQRHKVAGGADLPAAPTGAHLGHLALHASWQARLLLALCGVHSLPEAGHKAAQARRASPAKVRLPDGSAEPRLRRAAPARSGAGNGVRLSAVRIRHAARDRPGVH